MAVLRYPSDMDGYKTPYITFQYRPSQGVAGGSISLFSPSNIAFNDGAGYGEFNLGIIGMTNSAEELLDKGTLDAASIQNTIGGMGGSTTSQKVMLAQALKNMGLTGSLSERVTDIYKVKKGIAINPNNVLQYSSPTIRDFSFQFTLVANSPEESNTIKSIHDTFRTYMYPESSAFILNYPAKWDISFHKAGGGYNNFIPKIHECYLVSLNTVINPSGNAFHLDGAPGEIQVTVAFRETKMLNRDDIKGEAQ